MGSAEAIRDLVEPAVTEAGYELWDVETVRGVVRVLVDRPGGIDLDALASVASSVVSPLLDSHPELTPEGNFQLEVSSPGVERTLRTPSHFERYVGSEITAKTTVAIDGARRHHGIVVGFADQALRIAPKDGPEGSVVDLPLDSLERVRTVLVWGSGSASQPTGRPKAKKPQQKRRGAIPQAAAAGAAAASNTKDTA